MKPVIVDINSLTTELCGEENKFSQDASPVSKAQFRVLKIMHTRYDARDWRTVKFLKEVYDIQERTIISLAQKRLVKLRYITVIKKDGTRTQQLSKGMITNLGLQVTRYMIAFEELKNTFHKTWGIQKLK